MIKSYVDSPLTLPSLDPKSMKLLLYYSKLKFKKQDMSPDSVKTNKAFSDDFEIIVTCDTNIDVFLKHM